MKTFFKNLIYLILIVVGLALIAWLLNFWYDNSPILQTAFGNASTTQSGLRIPTDDPDKVATILPNIGGKISLLIFTLILIMQLTSVIIIAVVVKNINKLKNASIELKEAAFKNADIFFDLPLYIGLFGSVSSFVLISFSPQSSRLVAYSSTLIGIIFSVCAKIGLLYPVKRKLIIDEIKKNKVK